MNEVKRLTIKNRIRKAWKVLTGAPADNITIGLTVKRCDECDLAARLAAAERELAEVKKA